MEIYPVKDPVAVAAVLGWVQLIKLLLPDEERWKRWLPLVAVALGLVYAFSLRGSQSAGQAIVAGLGVGLAAAGSYSGARKLWGIDGPAPKPAGPTPSAPPSP